jgi:cytoskeletal protein CcmA (bactofilin family)
MFNPSKTKEMARPNETNAPEKLNRIVEGTELEGKVVSDSNIRIDGRIKGTVQVKGRLVVGPTGRIDGDIVCGDAEIEGAINGKIAANGLLSLKSTARLTCDMITQKLAIEPGAVFTGNCQMHDGKIPSSASVENLGVRGVKEAAAV